MLFWQRLMDHRDLFKCAIFLAFSLEQLQTTQQCEPSIIDFDFCVPAKRIRFMTEDGNAGPSPTHANAIVLVSGTGVNRTEQLKTRERFHAAMLTLGACI